ncbi:MAG TPA: S8 family serine peptidase [Candidatus Thermoplasmatota archaeon]|nr:S8 family serine peptidase [Candidatus Thermoplasmatota archaeon]
MVRILRVVLALAVLVLLVAPSVAALNVGAKSIKARPSKEYSPETAWDLGAYGCGVTIAVFDEGVDDRHPHLNGKVISGFDSTAEAPVQQILFGNNPQPLQGSHGTPVAGLALSHAGKPFFKKENVPTWPDDALVGVAPCAWMVDVMFSDAVNGETLEQNIVQAYEWAIKNRNNTWGDQDPSNDGIDIITMSWSPNDGTKGDDPISKAANDAVRAGIVVLGSMGNSGATTYRAWGAPAAADLTLGIGNLLNGRTVLRDDDKITPSSTRGPRPDDGDDDPYEELKPDVSSPGQGIVGAGASKLDGREYEYVCFGPGEPGQTVLPCKTSFGGTSAATPMTAGVVALMLSVRPDLTAAEIKEILHQTAQPHPEQTPSFPLLSAKYNYTFGYGMTDAYAAVKMALEWPGMELGKDTDADGVRDFQDKEPRNPLVADLRANKAATAVGGQRDTDGDGVPDSRDPYPLDPRNKPDAKAKADPGGVPGPNVVVAALALGLVVWFRRRLR